MRMQCANNSEKAFEPEKGLRLVGTSFAHRGAKDTTS